jgi:two-component system phosphate regulon sensor histidine kinase PhoR
VKAIILGARWLVFAPVLLGLVIWSALAYQHAIITRSIDLEFSRAVHTEVDLVAALVEHAPSTMSLAQLELPRARRITLIGENGRVLFDSVEDARTMDNHNSRPEVQQARRDGYGQSQRHSDTTALDYVYGARRLADGRILRVAMPVESQLRLENRLLSPLVFTSGLVAVVAGVVIMLHLWRDRMRVAELEVVARAFATGEFSRRASLMGGDALAHLGHELNTMGERLNASQHELAGQKALLDTALGALSEGVACIDSLDRVLYANSAYRQLAAGGAEVVDQPYYEHVPVLDPPLASVTTHAALPHRDNVLEAPGSEFEHRRRQLRALVTPTGTGVRVVVLHDLTELKRLEGARRDFIAAVSHELKTPLTSISGFAETLLDGALDQDPGIARDFVGKIARHSDRLAEIVRDVLTLSRLEQGAWEVRPAPTDLMQLGRTILDEYTRSAERQHVTLSLDGPDHLAAITDPELVRQLLGNLVSNAIRYNRPNGTIRLGMRQGDKDTVCLVVQDTGIGIPPGHRDRVFERFYRVDAHRSRLSGGTGLGLAIVKQLLDVLDGTIELQSDASGTCFTVSLPRVDPRAELAGSGSRGGTPPVPRL